MATLIVAIALGLLAALMLSVASAAPSAPARRFEFNKEASNSTPYVGDILTFTLNISPTAQLTQLTWIRVTDPNPAPAYLNILTDTIMGGAEVYSPTFNGVIREFTLTVGTLPQQISFQVEVTGIPTTALTSWYPVANIATITDASGVGSLPTAMAEAGIRIMPRRVMLPLVLRNYAPFTNGSFEAGLAGWQKAESPLPVSVVSSIQGQPSDPTKPVGDNAILLGNTSYGCANVPIGHAAVEQTFTVPEDATALTFKYIIWSQDASTSEKYDRFEVYINNTVVFSDGNKINTGLACDKWQRVPGPDNPRDVASGWATATIDLGPYRDQNITLSFRNYSRYDNYYNTYTYVDDVRVEQ